MKWKHFSYETDPMLRCPCGECDGGEMDPDFMRKLDNVRAAVGVPFKVTSGYRCPEYNAEISTTGEDGPHTTGRAVDIAMHGPQVWKTLAECRGRGIYGVGLKQHGDHASRFMHLDDLEPQDSKGPRPWVWTYA